MGYKEVVMCDECYEVDCTGQCTMLTEEETNTLMGEEA